MNWLIIGKVTLVFTIGWIVLMFMRRRSAAVRHAVICFALFAGALIPVMDDILPSWGVLPNSTASAQYRDAYTSIDRTSVPVEASPISSEPVATAPVTVEPEQFLFVAWLLGIGTHLVLLLLRFISMQLAASRATAIDDREMRTLVDEIGSSLGVRVAVEIKERAAGTMPAVWGLRRPVILLPADFTSWTETRRRDVVLHELAHIARHDVLSLTLARVVCALHWLNPLAWILKRRLALESEHACDDMALAYGTPAASYADHLLTTATAYRNRQVLAPVMAARSQLEDRIMAILDKNRSRSNVSPRIQWAIAAISVVLLVPLSSLTWAEKSDMWTNTTSHDHRHVHSDSAQFAQHLNELGVDTGDVDALLANLDAPNALTRAASAWALGDIDDPGVVDPLIRAGYDNDALVRQWAIRSLAPWVEPRVALMLVDRLQDPEAEVRQWAVRSLDRHDADVTTQPLIDTLSDSDTEVREWAVRVLARAGDARVQAAFADRIVVESDDEVRQWIVRSLEGEDSTDALINALYSESPEIRQWAVRGLAGTRTDRAVDALISMLQDNDDEVREWSARALGVCGNDRAIVPLQAMSADPSMDVREWAGRALQKIDC